MRKLLVLIYFFSFPVFAQARLGKIDWDYAYVDLNTICDRFYSLYPPTVKCIADHLYGIQYKISYSFRGQPREAYLRYIPEENAFLDSDGNIVQPDESIKGQY